MTTSIHFYLGNGLCFFQLSILFCICDLWLHKHYMQLDLKLGQAENLGINMNVRILSM